MATSKDILKNVGEQTVSGPYWHWLDPYYFITIISMEDNDYQQLFGKYLGNFGYF